jgi:hypothetical protein
MPPPTIFPSVVRREIGFDAVERLCAAERDAKARHDFIEDEHGAVLIAHRAQRFQKSRYRRHAVHIAGDGFDDETRDVAAHVVECLLHLRDVVVRERDRVRRELRRNAR